MGSREMFPGPPWAGDMCASEGGVRRLWEAGGCSLVPLGRVILCETKGGALTVGSRGMKKRNDFQNKSLFDVWQDRGQ